MAGKVRGFLFRLLNKEFLIFLFFLALSGIFWLVMTLNEDYEREIYVPVLLSGVPKNAVITSEMDDTLRVTVRDKGFVLASYVYGEGIRPIVVGFNAFANTSKGKGTVPFSELQRQLSQRLAVSTKIVSIKLDKLEFFFNYGLTKRVPVRLAGSVVPGKSYYLSQTKFWPEMVTIYASKQLLDSVKYVSTEYLKITNFEDTIIRDVPLAKIKGVKSVPQTVRIGLYPDVLTEETIEVPVKAVNMPDDKLLRTFPGKVVVKFTVGAGMVRNLTPEQFSVVADYNELSGNASDKCTIHLLKSPQAVRNAKLETDQVDYLIEKK